MVRLAVWLLRPWWWAEGSDIRSVVVLARSGDTCCRGLSIVAMVTSATPPSTTTSSIPLKTTTPPPAQVAPRM
ncbi:hypothetical protein E2C01_087683 [Portunus trituberculatus]|uniref:Secreted protein n=1 Tax=Portunus trituberculatus TaxID=210409 RepID=A0A5B7JEQ5_PORTR|nr:hypothetical protein [Portunus trituberculatus]